jgi:hypothetical protein
VDPLDRDMMRSDPVLRWYLAGIRLNAGFGISKWFWLFWLVAVPLLLGAIFWGITDVEGRFWLGSLDHPVRQGSADVIGGLSFLGDLAVSPFFLLLPLLLVLLRQAIGKTIVLYNECARLVHPEVQADPVMRVRFEEIATQAAAALRYRGFRRRLLWIGAIAVGLSLFGFNTLSSFRGDTWPIVAVPYDQAWSWLKPYGPQPAVIKPNTVVITLKDPASFVTPCKDANPLICLPPGFPDKKLTVSTDRRRVSWSGPLSFDEQRALAALSPDAEWQQAVQALARQKSEGYVSDTNQPPVEKWDTDMLGAPYSWWATRIWALLFGYALVPVAVLRVLNLVHVVWRFTKSLAEADMLKANPYSAESREGLELIVSALFAANYCLLVASLMVVSVLFKVGAKAGGHDLALLAFLPLFAFAALAPMVSISSIFEHRVKRGYLAMHEAAAGAMHQAFHDGAAYMNAEDAGAFAAALANYDGYLSRGQETAIFPVSWTTITNAAAPVTPLVLALGEKLLGLLF